METAVVSTKDHALRHVFDWGELNWYASAAQGNSTSLTVGRCLLRPGASNPRHRHPNCDEVLHVLAGAIEHELGDGRSARLGPGDTITVPAGIPHRARNCGGAEAVLLICFSTADRQTEACAEAVAG